MLVGSPWGYAAAAAAFAVALAVVHLLQRAVPGSAPASRIAALDGLRGFAALAVLCHHFLIAVIHLKTGNWAVPPDTLFANLGPVAVTVFFFITAVLFYRRAPGITGPREWCALYVSRLCRLAPLYLLVTALVIAIVFAIDGFAFKGEAIGNLNALAAWLAFGLFGPGYFNGNPETYTIVAGVTWTLRYEWVFYLALPLFAVGARWVSSRLVRMATFLICYVAVSLSPGAIVLGLSIHIASVFLLGLLGAELMAVVKWRLLLSRPWGAVLGAVALAFALVAPLPAYHPFQQIAVWLFFVPAICGNSYFGVLLTPAARLLGTVSYSMYLLHGMLLFVALRILSLMGWLPDGAYVWILLPALAVPLVALSAFTFRTIETPGIELGRRLSTAVKRPPDAKPLGTNLTQQS